MLNTKKKKKKSFPFPHRALFNIALNYYRFIVRAMFRFDDEFDGHEFLMQPKQIDCKSAKINNEANIPYFDNGGKDKRQKLACY